MIIYLFYRNKLGVCRGHWRVLKETVDSAGLQDRDQGKTKGEGWLTAN